MALNYWDTDTVPTTIYGRYGQSTHTDYTKKFSEAKERKIKKVIFKDPATIVFWEDGTKTVVKCDKDDIYDKEKGLAMAIAKKFIGSSDSKGNYYEVFKKWI